MFVKIHRKCVKNRKQINVGIFTLKQKKNYKEVLVKLNIKREKSLNFLLNSLC